jgi:bifunctional oligoribonuclease and PAP phosphatase NrnA
MVISLEELHKVFQRYKSFVLTTHVNPDGDAIGSELALCHYLRKFGKHVDIINHSATPDNYLWLDVSRDITAYDPARDGAKIAEADVILIVDANQPDRLRSMERDILASKAMKLIIDHHLEPHSFARYHYTDSEATSTGEILYRIITTYGNDKLDKRIARSLYTAIMTDTGSFRYPRTVSETHRIAADLLDRGADPTEIYANVYETFSLGRLRLLGEVLDSIKTCYDGELAYVVAKQAWFKDTDTTEADTDNFTVYPMSVQGVSVGILFNELRDGVKVSLRSKGGIPINELAKEFGGNGHLNAAGAKLLGVSLDEVIPRVIASAEKYINMKNAENI